MFDQDGYQIDEVSESQLKLGYWFITHQLLLKRILYVFLILLNLAFWIPAVYNLVGYIKSVSSDKQLIAGITDNVVDFQSYLEQNPIVPLTVSAVQAIYTGDNKYDLIASVANPNNRGLKNLSYVFAMPGGNTPTASISLLPGQTAYLMSLGYESPSRISAAEVQLLDYQWQSLRENSLLAENPISINQISFSTTQSGGFKVFWLASNTSLYNFWEVNFEVIAYAGSQIISVNRLLAEEFLSGETRMMELTWFERLPGVSRVTVIPLVDVYNSDNFFKVEGQASDLY